MPAWSNTDALRAIEARAPKHDATGEHTMHGAIRQIQVVDLHVHVSYSEKFKVQSKQKLFYPEPYLLVDYVHPSSSDMSWPEEHCHKLIRRNHP